MEASNDLRLAVGKKLTEIHEALFEAGATEIAMALVGDDVIFCTRWKDGHWGAVVWIDAGKAVEQVIRGTLEPGHP